MLSRNTEEPFIHRIVSYDEKWILYDNRKRLVSWLNKDEALKNNSNPKIHQKKLMVTAWWISHGSIHYIFMKPGHSTTAGTYCNQLDNMMKNLAEKQPRLVNRDKPILLDDDVHPQIANRTQLKILELYLISTLTFHQLIINCSGIWITSYKEKYYLNIYSKNDKANFRI